jgi:hypothetical protein
MTSRDLAEITRRLDSYQPASVLAIGAAAEDLLKSHCSRHPDCQITCLDADASLDIPTLLDALSGLGRFDFVLVRGILEPADAELGAHFLARLRDVHSQRLCVLLDGDRHEHPWHPAALTAMGLSHWASERLEQQRVDIYGFDLAAYKATPEWLNARHWAHPEHWGKYRW